MKKLTMYTLLILALFSCKTPYQYYSNKSISDLEGDILIKKQLVYLTSGVVYNATMYDTQDSTYYICKLDYREYYNKFNLNDTIK